ncbi:MAG: hypothetical protein ACE5ES_02445 [Candidatus Nanoarchaeia archaeon]
MKVKIRKHGPKKLKKSSKKKKISKKKDEENNPLDKISELLEEYEKGLHPRSLDDFEM